MNNFIILRDTRQQKESHIIKEFDKQNILHIQTKLDSADYMAIRYDKEKGFYKDYSILIDTKKDLLELCGNLCHTNEHQRILKEIELGKQLGAKKFIFLIGENKIKTAEDIKIWQSPHTKVRGEVLLKIMSTMAKRYDVRFLIVPRKQMGAKIIQLLTSKPKCDNIDLGGNT